MQFFVAVVQDNQIGLVHTGSFLECVAHGVELARTAWGLSEHDPDTDPFNEDEARDELEMSNSYGEEDWSVQIFQVNQ